MKRFLSIIMMMFFMSVSVIQVDAKMYKWRDENGKLHFTDDPSKIPQKNRDILKGKADTNSIKKGAQFFQILTVKRTLMNAFIACKTLWVNESPSTP